MEDVAQCGRTYAARQNHASHQAAKANTREGDVGIVVSRTAAGAEKISRIVKDNNNLEKLLAQLPSFLLA